MSLKNLPIQARPREKLLTRGPGALTDAELLALLLRTGIAGKGVMQLAEELLLQPRASDSGGPRLYGIAGLLRATASDLACVKGLGPAKRAVILAVLEMARRAAVQRLETCSVLSDPTAMKQHLQLHLAHRHYEVFAVCFLNAQNHLLALEELFRGSLRETSVYPREIALRALHHGAAALVLAHNHPSGSVQPSAADLTLTQTLKAAMGLLDVRILDHIIVAPGFALSFAERGLM